MLRTAQLAVGVAVDPGSGLGTPQPRFPTTTVFTCPDGHRAIVRDLRFGCYGPAPTVGYVLVSGVANGVSVWLLSGEPRGPVPIIGWECDIVLNGGDTLVVESDFQGLMWWVSGGLLPLP